MNLFIFLLHLCFFLAKVYKLNWKLEREREREKGVAGEIETQKERSARTAGKPTDQFVL